jgi:hypothetical protein
MRMAEMVLTEPQGIPWLGVAVLSYATYLVGLVIYRLYFSPIAKFPGPKLAAVTSWYEFYHDAIRHGQYTFEIAEMHKKYGASTAQLSTAATLTMCYRSDRQDHALGASCRRAGLLRGLVLKRLAS